MHFLLPSDPFDKAAPDEPYAEEFAALNAADISTSLFSLEDFETGRFKARPAIPSGVQVVYRGWMLSPEHYARLASQIEAVGASMRTAPAQYELVHYLPNWYPLCAELTPTTVFVDVGSDYRLAASRLKGPPYFIKDSVKSLTTERGSVARSAAEIEEVVSLIAQYRGKLDGNVCIREFVELQKESEERFFVCDGVVHARTGEAPAVVHEVARRVASPFYSVDVALSSAGESILIELGDGQVSDRKAWKVEQFITAISAA